jgi:hypothetical protein
VTGGKGRPRPNRHHRPIRGERCAARSEAQLIRRIADVSVFSFSPGLPARLLRRGPDLGRLVLPRSGDPASCKALSRRCAGSEFTVTHGPPRAGYCRLLGRTRRRHRSASASEPALPRSLPPLWGSRRARKRSAWCGRGGPSASVKPFIGLFGRDSGCTRSRPPP